MRISKINSFFARVGAVQLRFRWIIIAAVSIFTIFSITGLPKLTMSSNEEDWFEDWEQVKVDSDLFKEKFGSDDAIMIMVNADDVFAPEVLEGIERLGKRLEEEVPFADKATSLMTVEIPLGTKDSIEIKNPFENGVPSDLEELAEKKAFMLSRESLVNNLVSDDSKETWIILSLENYEGGIDFAVKNIARPAQKIIQEESEKTGSVCTFRPMGMSYSEMEEDDVVTEECKKRVVSGFFVMLLCLLLFVRSLRGVIVPIIATVAGIGSVLGLSARMGIEADSNMVTLPILLGMALSVGYSVHYVNSLRMHFRRTNIRKDSVIKAVEETGWPILFTVITTVASLVSFLFAGIGPIRWVGGISSSIVLAVYLYVIILIPILMSFGSDKKQALRAASEPAEGVAEKAGERNDLPLKRGGDFPPTGATQADLAFARFGKKLTGHSKTIAFVSALFIAAMIPGIFKIRVNMDYVEMMGNKVPYVARITDVLSGKLGSLYSYDLMISYDDSEAFKSVEKMKALDEAEKRLGRLRLTKISGEKPRVTSACGMIKEINRMFNDDDISFYTIPEDDAVLAQSLVFYADNFKDWFDIENDDFGTSHLHVELAGYDANKIVEDISDAKKIAGELFPDSKVSIVGE
ncbi:MAG: MMPL family transporter, partial [Treponema sp.]|nr:MMPL family transporter [Treponema sp.]